MDLGLEGVPCAVSGASRGLGYAVAMELAREGAAVAICSRDRAAIEKAAETIGPRAIPIVADVSTPEGASDFIESAARGLGGLQVLVTNAGGPPPGYPSKHDDSAWLDAYELNFLSAVRMIRAALPYLEQTRWGRIVCITSNVVKQPDPSLSLSSAVRSATTAFAKTLAAEVASRNITVNCVMPGQIVTDRLRSLAGAPGDAGPEHPSFSEMITRIPAARLGRPEELAASVAFLCSERASFINGVNLAVDGGFLRSL